MGKTLIVKKGEVEMPPLTEAAIKRGDDKGKTYFAPLNWSLTDYIKFWGETKIAKVIKSKVNTLCQNWHFDATNKETGVFDEDDYVQMFTNFSARGESVASIKEALMECALAFQEIDFKTPEGQARAVEIQNEMRSLHEDLLNKKRKSAEDLAAEVEPAPATA